MKKYSLIIMISLIYLMVCFPKVVLAGIVNFDFGPSNPRYNGWGLYVEETYIDDRDEGQTDIQTYSVMLIGGPNAKIGDCVLSGDVSSPVKIKFSTYEVSDLVMYLSGDNKRVADKNSIRWGNAAGVTANLGLVTLQFGYEPIYVIPLEYEVYNDGKLSSEEIVEKIQKDIPVNLYVSLSCKSNNNVIHPPDFKFFSQTTYYGGIEYAKKNLGEKGLLEILFGAIFDPLGTVADAMEGAINELLLSIGDGVLTLINTSVGEIVTIDRLVFDKVSKVSIDYFDKATDDANSGGQRPVKAMMRTVVNSWYSFFRTIAIIVYMIMLVVVGIRVMLSSTANKKAQYQDMLVNWVVGVIILFFFPYVMKYTIELNSSVLTQLDTYLNSGEASEDSYPSSSEYNMFGKKTLELAGTWGKDRFVELMLGKSIKAENNDDLVNTEVIKTDGMMYVRVYAQKLNKLFLTAVYFIQIGQMIVLLFMYYKRAFMIAFLITIFPLVTMTYVLDKVGDKKAQSFGIWFKEFLVNVIVQIFHATVYVIIVSTGVQAFIDTGGNNWAFMIISVLFLFQGEKILRNIFGVKSAAGTIGDLVATGAMLWGATKGVTKIFGGSGDIGSASDKEDVKGVVERNKQRSDAQNADNSAPSGGNATPANSSTSGGAPAGGGSDSSNSGTSSSGGSGNANQSNGGGSNGAGNGFDMRGAMDQVFTSAGKRKTSRGILSGAVNMAFKTVGGIAGATYGMSKGDTEGSGILGNAIAGATSGSAVGDFVGKPAEGGLNKIEQMHSASKIAKAIASGEMDASLGLDKMMPADIDPNDVVGKNGETMQEIYRRALAEMARVSGTKGMAKGEEAFFKMISDLTDESKLK